MSAGLRPWECGRRRVASLCCEVAPQPPSHSGSPGSMIWMLHISDPQARQGGRKRHDVFLAWEFGTLTQTPTPTPSQAHAARSSLQHYLSAYHAPPTHISLQTHISTAALSPTCALTHHLAHSRMLQPTAGSPSLLPRGHGAWPGWAQAEGFGA